MADVLTGADCIKGELIGLNKINALKNQYRAAAAPADAVAGVFWQDSADDRLYQYDGAAWNIIPYYEVGDWTPAITFGAAAVGVTYVVNNAGRYVRIGDWVWLTGRLQLTSKGSSVGDALLTPLPFTCKNDDGSWVPTNHRLNVVTFANQWTCFIAANTADITFGEQTEAGVFSAITNADFSNTSVVMIGAHYEIEV